MRIESSVTSVSWIPSEAIQGMTKIPFEVGMAHYDSPPPEVLTDLEGLRASDGFRFANELRAWAEVENGEIVDFGHSGLGHIGVTKVRLAGKELTFQAQPFPDLRAEPERKKSQVRFVQTAGGRTGAPAPRTVSRPPFVQIAAPVAWTTLALTINADGSSENEVLGASPFPRHWIYDDSGKLVAKSGLVDFKTWYKEAFGDATPWGAHDTPALVTDAETDVERELSRSIMRGKKIRRQNLKADEVLVEQGQPGSDLFLLLDGVLFAEVDGEPITEVGPGAILGERALLEGGTRTATLRAVTACRVAVIPGDEVDKQALAKISEGHRQEEG